jgi:hypothetical protein
MPKQFLFAFLAILMTLAKHYKKYAVVSGCVWDPAIANCEKSASDSAAICYARATRPWTCVPMDKEKYHDATAGNC